MPEFPFLYSREVCRESEGGEEGLSLELWGPPSQLLEAQLRSAPVSTALCHGSVGKAMVGSCSLMWGHSFWGVVRGILGGRHLPDPGRASWNLAASELPDTPLL